MRFKGPYIAQFICMQQLPLEPSSISLRILRVAVLCLSMYMAFIMGWPQLCSICVMPSWSPQRGQAASLALAWPGMYNILLPESYVLVPDWPHLAFKKFTLFWNGTQLLCQNKKLLGWSSEITPLQNEWYCAGIVRPFACLRLMIRMLASKSPGKEADVVAVLHWAGATLSVL